ncbi:cytidine deaminase [Diabrotica virgifera virgifera]|uniref:Cytidine deaminase n=1 Tax=Diabrotica virgifera virgifera TaxID=50390 RepID=A0A6P7GGP3_DIAVI|nr:cytidine deaminase [Diabrotica virgifera virgifera]XP_050501093.1 cytidine deaminase [Diabrotica virgifera virgifera]
MSICVCTKKGKENLDNIYKLKALDPKIQNLINIATEGRLNAYCPYSNFKVGASVMCDDGTIFSGCNVENSAFTVGLCAERCAYVKAISEGKMKFKAVCVVAQQENSFTTPCGACRQFMSEFGNVDVYITKPSGSDVLVLSLDKLLPYQFETVDHTFT